METIRILFYTDYSAISNDIHRFGLTDLKRFIELKIRALANVSITIRNRHFDYKSHTHTNGATPLTSTFLNDYDELWVFGRLQKNTKDEPHNELAQKEIDALSEWMETGGVLITGDHSQAADQGSCRDDKKKFINLGAAIGRRIPRAGDLRVWDGPPTNCHEGLISKRDNHNSQVGDNPQTLDRDILQHDREPQTLKLLPANPPHRLFWWYVDPQRQTVVPITKFPDHMHEGGLIVPAVLSDLWPPEIGPPVVVAQSRDNRFAAKYYDTIIAYDGDPRVGRIVADSSFHHFINKNLGGLKGRLSNRDPEPGTCLDQIAQFYANLALWLAPNKIRDQIVWGLFFEAARHPDVLEEKGNSASILGRTALDVINQEVGASNLYRLLAPSQMERKHGEVEEVMSAIFLGGDFRFGWVEPEKILGFVIQEYHNFFYEKGITDQGWLPRDPAPPTIAVNGVRKALQELATKAEEATTTFKGSAEMLNLRFEEGTKNNSGAMEMANLKCGDDWDSLIGGNNDGFFALSVDETTGEITGYHVDKDGNTYSVWGLCRHGFFSGHRIDIWEPHSEQRFAYHYFAKVRLLQDDDRITENGKRRRLPAVTDKADRKNVLDDEDWVGKHST